MRTRQIRRSREPALKRHRATTGPAGLHGFTQIYTRSNRPPARSPERQR
ncbi:hypothetical protein ACFFX0_04060 [Citricoccus parietis]|uniref:Uncharacterized protein n=1 Tax=Citricoccus parietis TaxID=592307 RepID=A0ABV5FUQ9_9MICC